MKHDINSKRETYYKRCQEIADYIHGIRISEGRYIPEDELVDKFGMTDYTAFLHEMTPHCLGKSIDDRNDTIEWIWKSRHFDNLAQQENRIMWSNIRSWIAIGVAIASSLIALFK